MIHLSIFPTRAITLGNWAFFFLFFFQNSVSDFCTWKSGSKISRDGLKKHVHEGSFVKSPLYILFLVLHFFFLLSNETFSPILMYGDWFPVYLLGLSTPTLLQLLPTLGKTLTGAEHLALFTLNFEQNSLDYSMT